MPLSPGDKLGPYRIVEPIGRGGMGEVFRAHDERTGRDVAIKVAAEQFNERFGREVRAVAALNHPNICTLFDVGPNYLVMEFIEGESPRGPVPPEEALRIARQIAAALEEAHSKGIVHRDLKPANIKIKPDGSVKVLDFGLAQIADAPEALSSNSPTMSLAATQAGILLGTAVYMSPEQARGKRVDKRADIWAFGVVIYEILTGGQLFGGDTLADTLINVATRQPDWDRVPPSLLPLLQRCLEKDPNKRLRDIGDMDLLLAAAPPPQSQVESAPPVSRGKVAWLSWGVAALATLLLAVLAGFHFREPVLTPQLTRFEIPPPEKTSFDNALQLSPDGRHLLFVTQSGSTGPFIWVRSLDTLQSRQIAPWSQNPGAFWSPDSRFIAFQQDGKLKKVDIAGGPPTPLCDAPQSFGGGAWSADNVIVFGSRSGGLMQVPSAGGVPVPLTTLDDKHGDSSHGFPSFLPDQKHFLYFRRGLKAEFAGIYVGQVGMRPEQQDSKLLIATSENAVYTPSPDPRQATLGLGFLLFLRDATLMAQPFDAKQLALKGEPVPIAEHVGSTAYGFGRFSASSNGGLVYFTGGGAGALTQLTWFDRSGKNLGTIGNPGRYAALAISPDGTRVAAEKREGENSDLWLIDAAPGGKNDRFTFDPGRETSPVWSPDGSKIVYAANPGGGVLNLFLKPSNLAGKEEELFKSGEQKNAIDWSRDGKTLSFLPFNPDSDIWTLNLSDKKPMVFFKTNVRDFGGRFSPDSLWLAYVSQVTGKSEVYVRPFPANDAGGQQMVSLGGGVHPLWRREGKELYYLSLENKVMTVAVTPGAALKFGQPKELFSFGGLPGTNGPYYQWDVTADGSKFLLNIVGGEATQVTSLTLVLNWTAGLK